MYKQYETIMGYRATNEPMPAFEPLGPLSVRQFDQKQETLRSPFVGDYTRTLGSMVLSEGGVDRATIGYTKYAINTGEANRPIVIVPGGGGPLFTAMLTDVALLGPKTVEHHMDSGNITLHPHSNALTILNVADIMLFEAAGVGFQEGVARSALLPGTDRRHFYGVKRDAASLTAPIHHTILADKLEGRPIVLAGPSYTGGFRLVQIAINLAMNGIDVQGLAFLNGHYDYALQDYHQKDDPRPFIAALPVMALANSFHQGRLDPQIHPVNCLEEYGRVAEWARGTYSDALRHPHDTVLRAKVAKEMADLILPPPELNSALDIDYLMEHELRIDTVMYTNSYYPNRQISLVDARYAYPELTTLPHDYYIHKEENKKPELIPLPQEYDDSAVDIAFASLLPEYISYYRQFLGQEEVAFKAHQLAYPEWSFPDIWERRRSHEAMAFLLQINPNLHTWIVSGIFDLICPPERTRMFLEELQQLTNVAVAHNNQDTRPFVIDRPHHRGVPTIDVRRYPMSHLLGGVDGSSSGVAVGLIRFLKSLPT